MLYTMNHSAVHEANRRAVRQVFGHFEDRHRTRGEAAAKQLQVLQRSRRVLVQGASVMLSERTARRTRIDWNSVLANGLRARRTNQRVFPTAGQCWTDTISREISMPLEEAPTTRTVLLAYTSGWRYSRLWITLAGSRAHSRSPLVFGT
mgnify:CR=1 FL=1